jgi:cyclopropane fatty-acyl-phospholipid synthase-like methyltransferase
MVSVHRYHEISESSHRIMNPLSLEKLLLVADICHIDSGVRVLDLASGKGEMLCQLAAKFGATGIGIDIYPPVVADARARAEELGIAGAVDFIEGDVAELQDLGGPFDVVSCIGATWIGNGLTGTLTLMKRWVEPGGWILVGEVYWAQPPSAELAKRYGQEFADLGGTLGIFEAAGVDLVEMVLSSSDDWDRYAASQWLNVSDWLNANPDDPDAAEVRATRDRSRRQYLSEERGRLGWGVFVGRAPA